MTKLTAAQQVALSRCTAEWQSAYQLRASIATLEVLVAHGILERRIDALGAMFSPRTGISYRLDAAKHQPAATLDAAAAEAAADLWQPYKDME